MKKILLLTWSQNQNYGTALQAYACKSVLEDPFLSGECKNQCDILLHSSTKRFRLITKIFHAFSPHSYVNKIHQYKNKKTSQKFQSMLAVRQKAFDRFNQEFITFVGGDTVRTAESMREVAKDYQLVVAGSDQIWNPVALNRYYLLEWVPATINKISYAASLSVASIPVLDRKLYARALQSFKYISIRDRACCKQLSQLAGKPVQTVVDPVVLLGKEKLQAHMRPISDTPYIFCYFLGGTVEARRQAIEYAQKNHKELKAVIGTAGEYRLDEELIKYAVWDVDPWQFLSLIAGADVIFTDSFHATVLAVMFHKMFYVYEKDCYRREQNRRITEFLSVVGLENRWEAHGDATPFISQEKWENAECT